MHWIHAIKPSPSIAIGLAALLGGMGAVRADAAEPTPAEALRARYEELREELRDSSFQRAVLVDSTETSGGAAGEVYALVDFSSTKVGDALSRPQDWCDILTLHLNVKYCRASTVGGESRLDVAIGRKHAQPLADAYRFDFGHRIAERRPGYVNVVLHADEGPFATSDHRIVVEGVAVARDQTFVHLSFSQSYGVVGGVAMASYLRTVGRDKVGFSIVGTGADGEPLYVGGVRGAVERNTMRYYLAIESFLGAMSMPPHERFEKRLRDWFAAAERHPRQLHEIDESEYLHMKRNERLRQRARF